MSSIFLRTFRKVPRNKFLWKSEKKKKEKKEEKITKLWYKLFAREKQRRDASRQFDKHAIFCIFEQLRYLLIVLGLWSSQVHNLSLSLSHLL